MGVPKTPKKIGGLPKNYLWFICIRNPSYRDSFRKSNYANSHSMIFFEHVSKNAEKFFSETSILKFFNLFM